MNFDRIARWYHACEALAFGRTLQRARVALLSDLATPREALIVGEGDGRFLREFLRRFAGTNVTCVEASLQMIELSRRQIGRSAHRVTFIQADIREVSLQAGAFDLIVTHFVLDCFRESDLARVVGKLGTAATRDAQWLLSDFVLPHTFLARQWSKLWLRMMYRFFRVVADIEAKELVDPTPFLREQFALVSQRQFRQGMVKSELWQRVLPVIPSRGDGEGHRIG